MGSLTQIELEEKLQKLELLLRIGTALSAEKNKDRLIEMILLEASGGAIACQREGAIATIFRLTHDVLGWFSSLFGVFGLICINSQNDWYRKTTLKII